MKRLMAIAARILYICFYPVFGVYLHNSRRTRVLIVNKNSILLHRSYGGPQKWSLPGGGIHKNENPLSAAIREVKEELGIHLSESELTCMGEDRLPRDRLWPRYAVVFYLADVNKQHDVKITRPLEVIEAKWFPVDNLPTTSKTVSVALEFYESLKNN